MNYYSLAFVYLRQIFSSSTTDLKLVHLRREPYTYSALLVMSYCALCRKDVHLYVGSASAERVGQEEVGEITLRLLHKWRLLGLAVRRHYSMHMVGLYSYPGLH